jgi:hypothetical protein
VCSNEKSPWDDSHGLASNNWLAVPSDHPVQQIGEWQERHMNTVDQLVISLVAAAERAAIPATAAKTARPAKEPLAALRFMKESWKTRVSKFVCIEGGSINAPCSAGQPPSVATFSTAAVPRLWWASSSVDRTFIAIADGVCRGYRLTPGSS